MRIVPFGEVLVAHDLDGLRRPPREHVLGVGGATRTLAALTIRRPVARALDLGTGSGTQALLASGHVEHVVATDISERAAWFARVNAQLNERANIEVRVGDGFDPVRGETFDLVVANPPFVVSPDRAFTFRDAGGSADAISRDVVREAAHHLGPGGVASILVNWIVRDGDEDTGPPRAWVAELPCDSIIIHHDTLDPLRYANQWLMESSASAPAAYGRVLARWLRYYERIGARSIASGAIVMRRTGGPSRVRVEKMTAVAEEGGPQLERILSGLGRFSGPDDPALLDARPALAGDHRVDQHLTFSDGAYQAHPVTLRLAHSAGIVAEVPADLLEAVFLIDGERSLGEIIDHLADARDQGPDELRARALPVFLQLFERGFLTLPA